MGPIGAGSIGQAIARRISAGKHVLLADLKQENADDAAEVLPTALAVLRSHQIKVLRNRSDKKPNSRVPRIPHAAQRWSSAHRDTRSREMKDHGRPR